MNMLLIRPVLMLLLALCSLPVLAVNYTIPGNMPPGCTGSGSSYTCPGGGNLGYNDTVTIASATPITITVNGNIATNNARINQGGSASNLTLIVNGTLTAEYQAVINANVQATVFNGSGSEVVVGGDLTATGAITLGYRTRVAGNVSGLSLTTGSEITFGGNVATTTGAMSISNTSTVAGNVSSNTGAISLAGSVQVAGQVNCACALTVAGQVRVTGNITTASVTATSQAYLLGSITTTGAVDVAYATSLGGAVTAGGTLRLRGNTQASQCLRTTASSAITLEWADRANGGVCCGALGSCTTSCVTNNSGAAMPALCAGAPPVTPPSRFNAFDTGTAAGITGFIRTKVAGTAFSVAIVAVNAAGTGVATTFTGNVRVEVLDSSNNNGTVNGSSQCNSNWTVASGTSAVTLNFAASDQGRKNVSFTVAEAFPDARIRISYPDTGTATVTGCSTDRFAIRPASFASLRGTDGNASVAGNGRLLSNTGATGGVVHKAGQPFTVSAAAINATSTLTTRYSGTPTWQRSACSGAYPCGGSLGNLTLSLVNTPNTGMLSDSNARYSEGGAFDLQLIDSSFAAVDDNDGSTAAEREIRSSVVTLGRFVPNDFGWTVTVTPQLQAGCGSFTYYGQPFRYALAPQATLTPRAANGGTTVNNYPSTRYGSTPTSVRIQASYAPASIAIGGSAAPTAQAVAATSTARVDGPVPTAIPAHTLAITRSPLAPQVEAANGGAPIELTWTAQDDSEMAVAGNQFIEGSHTFPPLSFASNANIFRYGQLKLGSAYGSELVTLAVPLETQYWDGTRFVTNAADQCTSLPTSSVSLANFRSNLVACRTAPSTANVPVVNGRGVMRLAAPGNGFSGSVEGTLQLGNSISAGAMRCAAVGPTAVPAVAAGLPWLQTRLPGGTTYDQNPSARFSFGQYRSPVIQLREMY